MSEQSIDIGHSPCLPVVVFLFFFFFCDVIFLSVTFLGKDLLSIFFKTWTLSKKKTNNLTKNQTQLNLLAPSTTVSYKLSPKTVLNISLASQKNNLRTYSKLKTTKPVKMEIIKTCDQCCTYTDLLVYLYSCQAV